MTSRSERLVALRVYHEAQDDYLRAQMTLDAAAARLTRAAEALRRAEEADAA